MTASATHMGPAGDTLQAMSYNVVIPTATRVGSNVTHHFREQSAVTVAPSRRLRWA